MPPQLKRLLPLFALFVFLFLVLRYFLIPESFGEHGHYRFNSVAENQNLTMRYAGSVACLECHDDMVANLSSDVHESLSCEACHGPALAHVEMEGDSPVLKPIDRDFCGLCHAENPTRNSRLVIQVDMNDHNNDKNCVECHNPHMPWELKE